ncbi:hypothetical protein [Janibacter sp. LM]|uniref:hypothetical protein n=1 Tax=Janibacter sp. LM TaxID=3144845 RepID=UPI0031F67664
MAPATPALEISEPLAALLVWVLEDHDVELAKEIIDKPHHFEDLSALHARPTPRSASLTPSQPSRPSSATTDQQRHH